MRIGYIVGSNSQDSINRRFARAVASRAPEGVEFIEIEIADLPFYNRDMDADFPAEGRALKSALAEVDAVVLVTPEYNRGTTAYLKNAIDFASRPPGESSWDGAIVSIIGASRGAVGTAAAQSQLRSIFPNLGALVHSRPEVYARISADSYDDAGAPSEGLATVIDGYLESLVAFVKRHG